MPVPVTPPIETSVIEAFSSIQGEGVLVGCRQIFIRLPHCNLSCRYCDTPFKPTQHCVVEDPPGSGNLQKLLNPIVLTELNELFAGWIAHAVNAHHSFSITGGEPLLHLELLKSWLPQLHSQLPIYLETNGTLPENLAEVISLLDWISMDMKLESVTGQATDWQLQREFLQIANQTNCYVKIVIGEKTMAEEVALAAETVSSVAETIPLVLQPVTRNGKVSITTARLLQLQQVASGQHKDTRVIPQTHVFLNLM